MSWYFSGDFWYVLKIICFSMGTPMYFGAHIPYLSQSGLVFRLCSPRRTLTLQQQTANLEEVPLSTYNFEFMQWAAVSTYLLLMRTPPHFTSRIVFCDFLSSGTSHNILRFNLWCSYISGTLVLPSRGILPVQSCYPRRLSHSRNQQTYIGLVWRINRG